MENDVIGVADNPANRYFDPLTSPTPRTSTDDPNPDPVPPPQEEEQPPARDPTPPTRPRQPTPPPLPPSAYPYGHDNGLFAETLEDSDETFIQWAARESHKDAKIRYPSDLKETTLSRHVVRAARFVHDGQYEDKRAIVRSRVRRTRGLLGALFGSGGLAIAMSAVAMGLGLRLRADDWDTYGQLARWTIAAFALACSLLALAVGVPAGCKMHAHAHIFLLKWMIPFYVLFIIPALGTGVAALPVARGVGPDAYLTKGIVLAYIGASGFISVVLSMVCIAASVLIIYDENKWYPNGDTTKTGWSGWKSNTIKDKDPEPGAHPNQPSDRTIARWAIP